MGGYAWLLREAQAVGSGDTWRAVQVEAARLAALRHRLDRLVDHFVHFSDEIRVNFSYEKSSPVYELLMIKFYVP